MIIPNILSCILCAPLIGLAIIAIIPADKTALIRRMALMATVIPFVLAIFVFMSYDSLSGGYQNVERIPWVIPFGISYHLGIDGINSLMLVLLGLVSSTTILISKQIKDRVKEYYILLLLVIFGTYGAFLSLDIFFFYFFHEIASVPVFLMIAIWGSARRDYAAMKLTLYLIAGASLALIGFIGLYHALGLATFDLVQIQQHLISNPLPSSVQNLLFPFIVFGFGITLTLWPFHTWAPLGYAEAPTAISMLHAGVLKKLGAYAIIRFAITLMPEAAHVWMPIIATLAVVNIIFCGLVALTQRDIKYVLGYSSCSHMGYILLGLACFNTIGLNGVVFLMVAHGIMAALAFALLGHMEQQTQTRQLEELSGLAKNMPFIGTCFIMVALASAGVPGFANFVAEILILLSAWDPYRWFTVAAVMGIVITAIYMLKIIRIAFHGPSLPHFQKLNDAPSFLEKLPFILLMAALIVAGCWPSWVINHCSSSIKIITQRIP